MCVEASGKCGECQPTPCATSHNKIVFFYVVRGMCLYQLPSCLSPLLVSCCSVGLWLFGYLAPHKSFTDSQCDLCRCKVFAQKYAKILRLWM